MNQGKCLFSLSDVQLIFTNGHVVKTRTHKIVNVWSWSCSKISLLFEGYFYQGIKLHIIYFSLTNTNIRTVIILFSIHLPSIQTPKSSSDETLWYSFNSTMLLHKNVYFSKMK